MRRFVIRSYLQKRRCREVKLFINSRARTAGLALQDARYHACRALSCLTASRCSARWRKASRSLGSFEPCVGAAKAVGHRVTPLARMKAAISASYSWRDMACPHHRSNCDGATIGWYDRARKFGFVLRESTYVVPLRSIPDFDEVELVSSVILCLDTKRSGDGNARAI